MNEQVKPKSALDIFFSLGDKVTKGDPKRKADFDYYMLWIVFLAFFGVFLGNFIDFVRTLSIQSAGWSLFGMAIMWFQYNNLKNMRGMREMQKNIPEQEIKFESKEDMLNDFRDKK